jgi:alpha-mannosidase
MRPSTIRLRRALLDLEDAVYPERVPLHDFRLLPVGTGIRPEELPIPDQEAPGWRDVSVGARWGGRDETVWFHAAGTPRESWREQLGPSAAVVLRLQLGRGSEDAFGWPEGLLYVNGRLQQGINRHHPDVLLRDEDVHTGTLQLDVRVWSGQLPDAHLIEAAELALLDRDAEALYYLLHEGAELVEALPEDAPLTYALAAALEETVSTLNQGASGDLGSARQARVALEQLRARLFDLRARFTPVARPVVTAIGHGHLDVAWLWQTRHTREKAARTFGVATALMDHYPEYHFLHTTPQVFVWLERDYPELYARVRQRVREGRFEAAGAMWVESDCNLVSGESLTRQLLYGERFLREEFDRHYDVLWLPDAFGYSAALPQIMLRAGITTFMTTKLSWSETNRMPVDTFRWRGLDGSEVLAHFITTPTLSSMPLFRNMDTYNGVMTVATVMGVWERYRQKAVNSEVLLAYGFGDGGAGPTRQHLERARALQALPGLPELRLGRADAYFARLRERVWSSPALPVWDGELYLEYHRGTYTTQGRLKRTHRQAESLLLLAEMLDAWRWSVSPTPTPDGRPALDEAWRALLMLEFHDILPGSSIGEVYRDTSATLGEITAAMERLVADAVQALAAQMHTPAGSLLVLNPSPLPAPAVVELPAGAAQAHYELVSDGQRQRLARQVTRGDDGPHALLELPALPARGLVVLAPGAPEDATLENAERDACEPARGGQYWLENGYFRLELNRDGEIVSLYDKRVPGGRELFRAGSTGNHLELFDDRPAYFDAWDIDARFEETRFTCGPASIQLTEDGPVRATLRVARTFRRSRIVQDISLYRNIPRVDFRTRIDWHEQHVLLKASFPLDLRTRTATSEIQYGALERPTHRNTSWDQARFETVAHRWVDLSEGEYGVSLLNDGRYGHDIRDGRVRLSLLRSPTDPDLTADQGLHEFTYSLYPHLGDWRAGETVAAAYALNRPLRLYALPSSVDATPAASAEGLLLLFTAHPANAVIEAIKRHQEEDGLIVRIYEAHGSRCQAAVTSSRELGSVVECDLLERPLTPEGSPAYAAWQASPAASHDSPRLDGYGWTFELRPFEVRTFHVRWR